MTISGSQISVLSHHRKASARLLRSVRCWLPRSVRNGSSVAASPLFCSTASLLQSSTSLVIPQPCDNPAELINDSLVKVAFGERQRSSSLSTSVETSLRQRSRAERATLMTNAYFLDSTNSKPLPNMTALTVSSTLPLKSGHTIPVLGFGTCQSASCTPSALAALKNSYTHIDTAQIYKNESETGAALAQSQISPSQLFITSKLWEDMYGREGAIAGVESSLKKLGLQKIDLYLLHTPRPGRQARHESWLGLQDAVEKGWVKSIGVSNWGPKHFEQLANEDGVYIKPVCNQIEYHPWNQQRELMKYCRENDIVVVAYSPLTQGRRLKDPTIAQLAEKHGKTPAQIVLRWCLQQGVVVIPKSDREERIVENKGIFGWELSGEDCRIIEGLDEGQKGNVGEWDPFAWD